MVSQRLPEFTGQGDEISLNLLEQSKISPTRTPGRRWCHLGMVELGALSFGTQLWGLGAFCV